MSISENLPETLPSDELLDTNSFVFESYTENSNQVIKTEYRLSKSPVISINEVTGILDQKTHTFENGTDYELSDNAEKLLWVDSGDSPDINTEFEVTYRAESVLSRYVGEHQDQLDQVETDLQKVINSRFVDKATGDDLDRIGSLFGRPIGLRQDRTDEEYRKYLKSVIKSFISRGSKPDIKQAVAASLDIQQEQISIDEDFNNTTYNVEIKNWSPVNTDLIDEITEIADPSGVFRGITRFVADKEDVRALPLPIETIEIVDPGDFYGVDKLNGDGSFSGGDNNNTFNKTSSKIKRVTVDNDETNKITFSEGYSSSSFAAGNFDGEPDKPLRETRQTTSAKTVSIQTTTSQTSSFEVTDGQASTSFGSTTFDTDTATDRDSVRATTITQTIELPVLLNTTISSKSGNGFSADSFDGNGGFGAGDSNDTESISVISEEQFTVSITESSSNKFEDGGVGSDLFDGNGIFE